MEAAPTGAASGLILGLFYLWFIGTKLRSVSPT